MREGHTWRVEGRDWVTWSHKMAVAPNTPQKGQIKTTVKQNGGHLLGTPLHDMEAYCKTEVPYTHSPQNLNSSEEVSQS